MIKYTNSELLFLILLRNNRFKDTYGFVTYLSMYKLYFNASEISPRLEKSNLIEVKDLKEYKGKGFTLLQSGVEYLEHLPNETIEVLMNTYGFLKKEHFR